MPQDAIYLPVWAGAAVRPEEGLAYRRDDSGDNISLKNPRYSELTALYWGARNLDADFVGLAHYRRHFKGSGDRGILTGEEAAELVSQAPVVLPSPRRYVVETLESHYAHTHGPDHLRLLEGALGQRDRSYLEAYREVMGRTSGRMFNMCIMRRDLLKSYCDWLFPLLASVEERIDFSGMSPYDQRCMGRLAEFLLNVWVERNSLPFAERPVVDLEPVDWVAKGSSFLRAKFLGTRYDQSFRARG